MKEKVTRRDFLIASGLGVASTFLRADSSRIETEVPKQKATILIVTDPHLNQNSSKNENILRRIVDYQKDNKNIDLFLVLGDLISEDLICLQNNKKSYQQGLQLAYSFNREKTINLLGNHDLWGLTENEITRIYQDLDIDPRFFGRVDLAGHQIYWVKPEVPRYRYGYLSLDQALWITLTADPKKPILLFSHLGLFPQDVEGNIYFQNEPQSTTYDNSGLIDNLISDLAITIVNGHAHWFDHTAFKRIDQVTLPNTFGKGNDEIYTILDIDGSTLRFKVYNHHERYASVSFSTAKR